MTHSSKLTFVELNRRLSEMPDYDSGRSTSPQKAKFGLALAVLAFSLSILVSNLPIPGGIQIVIMLLFLALEILGITLNFWYTRQEYFSLRAPIRNFAEQLDHDTKYHFGLIDWLASLPIDTLERHSAMATFRRERFNQRLPLLFGSTATLGIIPVFIAVYLQAEQYMQGKPLGLVDTLAGLVLALLYALNWMSAMMRSRVEAMDMYLHEAIALKQKTERPSEDTVPAML
ncbi:hypothetical protein GCM10009552_23190 [Rothia nasimurium]|uniref:DUF2270 domain-containing protein n=1 Tax=Luteibacter anthropi TaxID=564369 RepID=A0A7X5UE30_9GAMM|nr:hypothetical protein [Luteibacter anthropi]NII08804.1 hypothetical protein [Luteibacter anthropi]